MYIISLSAASKPRHYLKGRNLGHSERAASSAHIYIYISIYHGLYNTTERVRPPRP